MKTPAREHLPGRAAPVLLLAAAIAAAAGCGGRTPPNVLLLVMDTTRGDRCGFNGHQRPTTPRLDEFARDAVVFREAWSPSNWTGPSHASLFTGMRPESHGMNGAARPNLGPELPTLAEQFAAAGYDTACVTNNNFVSPEFGLTRGFATYEPLFKDERRAYPSAKATHDLGAAWAEESHAAGRPFFLFINDIEPHKPYKPPAEVAVPFVRGEPTFLERQEAEDFSAHRSVSYLLGLEKVDDRRMSLLSDLYDAEIATLDAEVGRLLDRLRTGGLLDDTVVVIVGDHGEYFGEHELIDHTFGMHRAVLHVPLIVRHKGSFDGGRVVRDVVRIEDVPPTLLELCGLPPLPGIDGLSLTRDLAGRPARGMQTTDDVLSVSARTEFPHADVSRLKVGMRSVFDGTHHFIAYSDGRAELYDVTRDPGERENLAPARPDDVARLTKLLSPPR